MQELRCWDILRALPDLLCWQNNRQNAEYKDTGRLFLPPGLFMGKVVRAVATLLCLTSSVWVTAQDKTTIIPLDQIHEGMRGIALTVFQGTKPEPMDVEVLGVLRNVNGAKGDIILVKLHGTKPEYTGVVAGMSGSPVYFDGKLAVGLPFRIGELYKKPIRRSNPLERMLEIDAADQRPAPGPAAASIEPNASTRSASPSDSSALPAQG